MISRLCSHLPLSLLLFDEFYCCFNGVGENQCTWTRLDGLNLKTDNEFLDGQASIHKLTVSPGKSLSRPQSSAVQVLIWKCLCPSRLNGPVEYSNLLIVMLLTTSISNRQKVTNICAYALLLYIIFLIPPWYKEKMHIQSAAPHIVHTPSKVELFYFVCKNYSCKRFDSITFI